MKTAHKLFFVFILSGNLMVPVQAYEVVGSVFGNGFQVSGAMTITKTSITGNGNPVDITGKKITADGLFKVTVNGQVIQNTGLFTQDMSTGELLVSSPELTAEFKQAITSEIAPPPPPSGE